MARTLRPRELKRSSSRLWIVAFAAFLCLTVATGYRVVHEHYPGPGHPREAGMGFCDYYNGVYYPTKAFLAQDNPYSDTYAQQYPVSRQVPLFSPLVFFIHSPFTLLDTKTSAIIYSGWLMALVLALAVLTLKVSGRQITAFTFFAVAGYLLLTRAGQVTLYNGYFTLELVIGAILALHYGNKKPALAGVGLALASCKPTYAIPLTILMLAKRNVKATLIGVSLSALFMAAGILWLAIDDSVLHVIQIFGQSQEAHGEFPNLWPLNTWTRIDLLAIVSKWFDWRPTDSATLLTMLGVLGLPCGLLFMLTKPSTRQLDSGAAGIIGLICMLSMLVAVYHHFYDAIILVVPTAAMILRPTSDWKHISTIHRTVLAGLINFPLLNYFSARLVVGFSGLEPDMPAYTLITSVNGICLTLALVYGTALATAMRLPSRSPAMSPAKSA
jgi:hypothetical protein